MGVKYIIEIPEDKIADFVGSTHFLMPYLMAGHIGHHDTGLPIAPYTEPDMEQVRKEAYDKGYDDAAEEKYNDGFADAWECVDKINSMSHKEQEECFGRTYLVNIMELEPSEAIEKIRQYEQEKEEDSRLRRSIKNVMSACDCSLDEIAEVLAKMKES